MAEARNGTNASQKAASTVRKALWTPQVGPQVNAITADWCPILFYGGGKYSGKTDFLLGDYLQDLARYREHWQGIVFRRALTEFTEMKLRSLELFPKIGGEWHEQKSEWRFPTFGKKEHGEWLIPILRFKYLENLRDIRLYEGHSYPWIAVDELGDWEDKDTFFRLYTCNRYGRYPIPNKRFRATGNPGGSGHVWISEYFVDPAPLGSVPLWDDELKCYRMFILGTYRDNIIGLKNDPGYPDRLNRAGSPELVRALREGDFSIVAGAFFPEFSRKNICDPFTIPTHWTRIMGMDYGGCGDGDPFAIGWYAVSDGTVPDIPKGALVCYREWYGAGLPYQTVEDISKGIHEREAKDEKILRRVGGGDINRRSGVKSGPSIYEAFSQRNIYFEKADQNRADGWQQLRMRIKGDSSGPQLIWFATCPESIKLIKALQRDISDRNDASQSHDHIGELNRYVSMSRPYVSSQPGNLTPEIVTARAESYAKQTPTLSDLWDIADREYRDDG